MKIELIRIAFPQFISHSLSLSLSVMHTVVSQFYESQVYDEYVIKVFPLIWNKCAEHNLILNFVFKKKICVG